jgi:hypothetical protein
MQYPFSCMPHVMGSITVTLSPARLSPFVREAGGDVHQGLRLYIWNARLCEEFYIPLQLAEVAIRNTIGSALCDHYGQDWYDDGTFINILPDRHKQELSAVVGKKKAKRGANFRVDDVIAGMTFGFWVHLMKHNYSFIMKQRGLSHYFPGIPKGGDRRGIYDAIEELRDFRKDIFHHEPIFIRGPKRQYANIRAILSWVCPNTLWLMSELSNPDVVLQARPRS